MTLVLDSGSGVTVAFALQIDPPIGGNDRPLLGLSLPLRLALTAQSAGAVAIVAEPPLHPALRDERLRIPVLTTRPSGAWLVRTPANLVIHRGLLGAALQGRGERDWSILEEPYPFDVPFGFDPILVQTPEDQARARKALLRSLRKPQDGWTSTYLNRYISLFFTRFLVATPLRPNQVSVAILAIGLAGAWLATRGTYLDLLVGAFLFQAQSVLDGCDGEMSRLTFQGSKMGEWLDTIGDDLTNYGYFTGASWGLYTATQSRLYLVAGAIILACGVITSTIEYAYLIKIGSGDLLRYPLGIGKAPGGNKDKGGLARVVDAISPLFKRDTFVLLTLLGAVLGFLQVMIVLFALGAMMILLAVINAEMRMRSSSRG
ncbi:MAG: CDP-alcohol phosphatidyltransferase family protein [Myxococcales bacterium]|nr:CDP-alcohol phosphatidyltransferase family protein [Polyangiaceae bacterium]MDW8249694.1 CDP-alcohol phosphatidyltransferase family protein [Myxococcales bacterium]